MRHNDSGRVFAPSPLSKSFSANDDSISATSQTQMMSAPRLLFSAVEIPIARPSSDTSRAGTENSSDNPATETKRILRPKGAKKRHKRT
jgi:hypothetical protein